MEKSGFEYRHKKPKPRGSEDHTPFLVMCIIAFAGRYIICGSADFWMRRDGNDEPWTRLTASCVFGRRCYNFLFWYYYYYIIITTTTTRKTHDGRDVSPSQSSRLPRPCLFYSVRLTKRFYWIPRSTPGGGYRFTARCKGSAETTITTL